MTQVQTFILNDDDAARRLFHYLKAHRKLALQAGAPLQVTVAPYHGTRTTEQNQTMWGILKAMSEQVRTEGDQQHSQQAWNVYAKQQFLPDRCSKGIDKWRQLADGSQELVMSTSDLNELEMDLYLSLLRNYATAELGVELKVNRG